MKILIAGLKKNSQLKRLQEEAKTKGHEVFGCFASELTILCKGKDFIPSLRGKDLTQYDLIYLIVGKRRWEWYAACQYLHKRYKTIIVNSKVIDPSYKLYLTPAMNYLRQGEEGLTYPKSALIFSEKSIDSILTNFSFPLIVKTSQGRQGRGVYRVETEGQLREVVKKLEADEKVIAIVVREFIPNDGDIRIFTIGYKAVGAMRRIPPKGEFRSNISQGGRGEKFELDNYPEIRNIAEKAAEITRTEIAGVDIIIDKETGKPYILEVNPSPQFAGLEKFTGANIGEEMIKYFENLYINKNSAR
jgi:RimK family alpha-L-glutamate ligase